MNGIVLIDKPAGVTSFKVTAAVRKKLNIRRVGHAGTLDPLATGVLPIMVGQATRLIDLIPSQKKRYTASFMLGMTTDTLDNEGEVLSDQPVNVTRERLEDVIARFEGKISQIPPMYSALQRDGVRLYELARRGIEVERPPRRVTMYSIKLLEFDGENASIDVVCSKGTYIRTLIDDIGQALGCGAFMTALRRTESNGFDISQCVPLDDFINGDATVHTPDFALKDYPAVYVTPAQAKRFSNGGELDMTRLKIAESSDFYRVYGENMFLGAAVAEDGALRPKCIFKGNET